MATPNYSTSQQYNDEGGDATATVSVTPIGGSDRGVFVWFFSTDASPAAHNSVTWNGVALTKRGSTLSIGSGRLSLWHGLDGVFPGSAQNIVATAAASQGVIELIITQADTVDQVSPYRNASPTTNTGTDNAASGTITSNAADLAIGAVFGANGSAEVVSIALNSGGSTASTTSRQEVENFAGAFCSAGMATTPGASSVTQAWTFACSGGDTMSAWGFFGESIWGSGSSSTLEQEGYRVRNDDGNETAATAAAAQDTEALITLDTNYRLRVIVNATAGDPASKIFKLEYRAGPDSTFVPLLLSAPAEPTFQAVAASSSGTGAISPVWPTHQAGDIGLLLVESCGGEAATLSNANGLAAVATSPQATGATTAGTQITAFWCRATSAAMAAPTVADPGNHVYGRIYTFRGCIAEGNPWDVTGGGVKASASTSVTVTGVTTTVPNTLCVMIVSSDVDSASAFLSAQSNGNLTSLTERGDEGTTQGNGGAIAVTTGIKATAGATGDMTATVASSINAFLTIALRPQTTPIMMATSANIASGGEASTALLTAPSGKTSGADFQTGRVWDDENGTDALDLGSGKYTEVEWCFKAISANGAAKGKTYKFRVTDAGTALDTYTVVPSVTIPADITAQAITLTQASASANGAAAATLSAQALTLTQADVTASGTVLGGATGNATVQTLTLTQATAAATGAASAAPSAIALTLTQGAAVATNIATANLSAIALTLTQAAPAASGTATNAITAIGLTLTQPGLLALNGQRTAIEYSGNGSAQIRLNFPGFEASRTLKTVIFDVWVKDQLGYFAWFWDHWGDGDWHFGTYEIGRHPYPGGDGSVVHDAGDDDGSAADGQGSTGVNHYFEEAGGGLARDWLATFGSTTVYPVPLNQWIPQAFTDEVVDISGTDYIESKYYLDLRDLSKVIVRRHLLSGLAAPPSPVFSLGSSPWGGTDENANAAFRNIQLYDDILDGSDIVTESVRGSDTPVTVAGAAAVFYSNINPIPSNVDDYSGQGNHAVWDNANRPLLLTIPDFTSIALSLVQASVTGQAAANTSTTAIALSLTQPSAAGTVGQAPAVTVQALTLTQNSPTATGTASAAASVTALSIVQGTATGSGESAVNGNASATAQSLTLTQFSVTATGDGNAALSLQTLTLTQQDAQGQVPGAGSADAQTLTLTQFDATARGDANAAITVQTLTLTQQAATADGGNSPDGTANLGQQTLTLTQFDVTANGNATAALSLQTLTLTQQAAAGSVSETAALDAQTLTLTQFDATASGDATATLSVQTLTLTQQAPTPAGTAVIGLDAQTLTLTQFSVAAKGDASAAISTQTLTLSQQAATADGTTPATGQPDAQTLTITQNAVQARGDALAQITTQVLSLVQQGAAADAVQAGFATTIALLLTQFSVAARGDAVAAILTQTLTLVQQTIPYAGPPIDALPPSELWAAADYYLTEVRISADGYLTEVRAADHFI